MRKFIQIKSSLYSPYYAEAFNELRGPPLRLSAWATQLRRNVATVASRCSGESSRCTSQRWRETSHCDDLTGPGIEPQTYRTDSARLTTELTTGLNIYSPVVIFPLSPKFVVSYATDSSKYIHSLIPSEILFWVRPCSCMEGFTHLR